MNHALCAVQINLVNADYTAGPGEVTQLSVASPALATTASLNANTGTLSTFTGQGDAITVDKTITLTGESQGTKIIAIPTGTQGNLTVKAVVDGATSTVPVTLNQPFVQGKAYVVNLKVKDAKTPVELVSVTVKEWTEEALGEFDIIPIPVPDDKYSIEVTIPDNGKVFQSNVCEFTGTIDWGDGTEPTTHSKENNPSHTYVNAGKYTITHKGVCHTLGIYIPDTGTYKNKRILQFTDITDILHIGKDLDIRKMNYAFAFSRLKELRKGILDKCTKVTTFEAAFAGNEELTSIPQGLFDKCSKATNFKATFQVCPTLTSIPQGLFDSCKLVINFSNTFNGCVNLTGESPYTLIDGVKVHLYERHNYPDVFTSPNRCENCFNKCTNLTDYDQITSNWK